MARIMQANVYANKITLSNEEWRDLRRKGIGGSDAAGIMGLNPYSTPFSVYADKLGILPEKEDTEAMRQGRDLEEYVARRFREDMAEKGTPKRTKETRYMLQHPNYPWMLANVDRLIIGEEAGLECKTTSVLNLRKFKNGEYPDQYYVQCVHYMAVTGAKRWYLGVLILNQGYKTFIIERDEEEIELLIKTEKEFWENHVRKSVPPEIDGLKATTNALGAVYNTPNDREIVLADLDIASNLMELKAEAKAIDEQISKCENILKAGMGDNSYASCGDYAISWKQETRSTFDAKRFAAEHKNIDLADYYKISTFRKFSIKEKRVS